MNGRGAMSNSFRIIMIQATQAGLQIALPSVLQVASSLGGWPVLKARCPEGLIPAFDTRAQPCTVPRTSPGRPATRHRCAAFTEGF